jgi:hypothetical protein
VPLVATLTVSVAQSAYEVVRPSPLRRPLIDAPATRRKLADATEPVRGRLQVGRYSYLLAELIPQARVKLYPDAAHGFLFQHGEEFATDVEAGTRSQHGEVPPVEGGDLMQSGP